MPTAAKIQWPQGQPLFEVQWRAVAESLAGNGVRSASDLEVTATATDLEIQVATGTAFYLASESTLGAAETHTLSAGDGTNDRWDTVYFDTSTDSSGVREGTPAADPEPPDVQGDELLLAVVYVPQNATDVPDSDVLNWRAQFSNEAEEVHYDDSTGVYSVSSVDAALDELQEAAQISAYPLANSDLANSSVTVNAGNGLGTTSASIALGGSATLSIQTDAIGTDELLLSITPTWTGAHTWDAEQVMAEIATPASPATGYNALYFKSDDNLYKQASDGTETQVGASAIAVQDDGSAVVSEADTLDYAAGLGVTNPTGDEAEVAYEHQEVFEGRESGNVSDTNQGILVIDSLADGETVEVYKAALTLATGEAAPSSLDLELVTLDNAGGFTSQSVLISGDGATVFDDETGSPLGTYTNSSGGAQTIGVLVDNGTGSAQDVMAVVEGVTGA